MSEEANNPKTAMEALEELLRGDSEMLGVTEFPTFAPGSDMPLPFAPPVATPASVRGAANLALLGRLTRQLAARRMEALNLYVPRAQAVPFHQSRAKEKLLGG